MRFLLQHAQGLDIYLIISLFIFLAFFIGMGIWLITADKKSIDEAKNIPLRDDHHQ